MQGRAPPTSLSSKNEPVQIGGPLRYIVMLLCFSPALAVQTSTKGGRISGNLDKKCTQNL